MNESSHEARCYGADVSAAHLDLALHGQERVQRVANEEGAIRRWLRAVPAGSNLGLESTGSYHELLARLAHAHGLIVYLLNPRDVKRYAQGLGQRGKTDRMDARVIARFVQREHAELRPWQPATPQQQQLADLLRHRALVQKHYSAQKQSLAQRPQLRAVLEPLLAQMDKALDELERLIGQAVRELPGGAQALRCVTSVPGIGLLSGAALLKLFTRLHEAKADAVVAFTGLDPRPMDSGQRQGQRRLSKRGDAELRRLLYNAAMSAARTAAWRPTYERERAKGLSATAALVALARRLVRVAYALFKTSSNFDPRRVFS